MYGHMKCYDTEALAVRARQVPIWAVEVDFLADFHWKSAKNGPKNGRSKGPI